MESAAIPKSETGVRSIVVLALLIASGALLATSLRVAVTDVELVHALGLLAIAFGIHAWLLFPVAAGVSANAVLLVCLAWAWAVRQTAALGWEVAAFGLLVGAAAWRRRRWAGRFRRLQQVLEDCSEEQTVKDQAIALAGQANEALGKKLSRYTQLQTIAEELSSMTELGSVAALAVERAFTLIGKSDVCLLFLVDQEKQELSLFASKRGKSVPSIRAKHGDQFDRHVLRSHRPLLVNDVRRDFRFTVAGLPQRQISSVLACPLLLDRSPAGVLRLDSSHPGVYTQDDLRFLDILLDLLATAVTNAHLFAQTQRLAMTDGLTGLMLRRPFHEQLTRELSRSGRSREPLALLMIDLDHFKAYNDSLGHTAGDVVLREVAEALRTVVPPGGTVARYGGEEFVVLLPRLSREDAAGVAEKIRELVGRQVRGDARHAHRPISVSVGVAVFPDDAQAELELVRIADQRLYQAKRLGRNLVCAF